MKKLVLRIERNFVEKSQNKKVFKILILFGKTLIGVTELVFQILEHCPVKQKIRPKPDEGGLQSPVIFNVKSDKVAIDSRKLNISCMKMRPHTPINETLSIE